MSYQIQSILLDRNFYSKDEAIIVMKNLKGKIRDLEITENYFRFRQLDPKNLRKRGYSDIRTRHISPHIQFIIYYKP
jgi:hypothetical protein